MKAKRHGRSKSDHEKVTIRRPATQSSATTAASLDNEDSLQNFFNALDDLVFVFEPDGRILFANPATLAEALTMTVALGTVLWEPVLVLLRRLALEHVAAERIHPHPRRERSR